MLKYITLFTCLLLFGSCDKNNNKTNQKSKNKESKVEDSISSSIDENQINRSKGLNYVKIFMKYKDESNQFQKYNEYGIIIKCQNGTFTGCLFEYTQKHGSLTKDYVQISELEQCQFNNDVLTFNYKKSTLDALKTGDYNYYIGYVEIYNQFLTFKSQEITNNSSTEEWDNIEGYERIRVDKLPDEVIKSTPEFSKFTNLETIENNKNLLSYSEIRGTLIQETNISALEEMMGKPDDIFDHNNLEWDVYYFAVQKNGKVGHLVFRINGLHPRIIDEITFYNPSDKIRVGNSYFVSPVTRTNNN